MSKSKIDFYLEVHQKIGKSNAVITIWTYNFSLVTFTISVKTKLNLK